MSLFLSTESPFDQKRVTEETRDVPETFFLALLGISTMFADKVVPPKARDMLRADRRLQYIIILMLMTTSIVLSPRYKTVLSAFRLVLLAFIWFYTVNHFSASQFFAVGVSMFSAFLFSRISTIEERKCKTAVCKEQYDWLASLSRGATLVAVGLTAFFVVKIVREHGIWFFFPDPHTIRKTF